MKLIIPNTAFEIEIDRSEDCTRSTVVIVRDLSLTPPPFDATTFLQNASYNIILREFIEDAHS